MPVANVRRPTLWLSANRLIVFDLKSVLFNALYGCLGHPSSTPYPVLSSTRQSPSDAPLWASPDRRGSDKGVEIQKRKRGRGDRRGGRDRKDRLKQRRQNSLVLFQNPLSDFPPALVLFKKSKPASICPVLPSSSFMGVLLGLTLAFTFPFSFDFLRPLSRTAPLPFSARSPQFPCSSPSLPTFPTRPAPRP